MNESSERSALNVVDLFCGGGGLTCGFELHAGKLQYCTVLGVDNDPAAIRIFNANFPPRASAVLPTGRLGDLTWFTHPVEIRLFYLVHCAFSRPDDELKSALGRLGIVDFLRDLRFCDCRFSDAASELASFPEYQEAVAPVPAEAFTLALPQAIMNSLALSSIARPTPDARRLPWCEEYQALLEHDTVTVTALQELDSDLLKDCQDLWAGRIQQLREAASKTGYGQNRNNSARLRALAEFFDSAPAQRLCALWTAWRAERETMRAKFCLGKGSVIDDLYSGPRRAHLVLGGPPCKGFSRMGRPVIQALRDQGVHAWSHKEYGDERNSLMCQYVLFLEALKPDVFLFENVSNFQSILKTPNGYLDAPALLEELIDELSEGHVHYHLRHQLVNARNFAVPQDRRRFIMLGINAARVEANICSQFFDFKETKEDVPLEIALLGLGDPAVFSPEDGVKTAYQSPVYNFFDQNLPGATRKYLAWIQQPDPATGTRPQLTTAHIYRQSRPDDRAFIEFVAPGMRWMDLKVRRSKTLDEMKTVLNATLQEVSAPLRSKIKDLLSKVNSSLMLRLLLEHTQEMYNLPEQHLLLEGYLQNGGAMHGDWFERLCATKPCKTIVAHIGKDTYGYWHPTEPRALTIREAARVQSFPDFFRLDSSGVVDTYAVIGNAVPPLLSAEFASRIEKLHCEWTIFGNQVVRELQAKPSSSSRRGTQYQLTM